MTEAGKQALSILRSPDHFQWYLVPFLALVLYAYVNEAQKGNWRAVLTGLILAAAEFAWEILNALVLHFSNYAALYSVPGSGLVGNLRRVAALDIKSLFDRSGLIIAGIDIEHGLRVPSTPARLSPDGDFVARGSV